MPVVGQGPFGILCPELERGSIQDNEASSNEEKIVQNTHVKVESCTSEIALMTLEVIVKGKRESKREKRPS